MILHEKLKVVKGPAYDHFIYVSLQFLHNSYNCILLLLCSYQPVNTSKTSVLYYYS